MATPWTGPADAHTPPLADDGPGIGWGLLCIAIGLLPIAVASGAFPTNPASIHAPRWILGLCGLAFLGAGVLIFVRHNARLSDLSALVLLTALGVIGGWVALFGQSAALTGGVPMLGPHANATLARALFAFGALVSLALAAYAAHRLFAPKS